MLELHHEKHKKHERYEKRGLNDAKNKNFYK